MDANTQPTPAATGATPTPAAATAQAGKPPVIRSQLGLELTIVARGPKPGQVNARRSDGGLRTYNISELKCDGGAKAILAEIERVCGTDTEL